MASGIVVNLQEEVTCPICLELLTEPLSLDCGHSFCQACITANNMVSMSGQDEERRCPVCRISYEPGNLRPNRHVANIVQRLREVKLSPEVEHERNLCLRHGEKLMLFCEEDREVICWLCERSQEHHGHHTFLIEEVSQDYQKKLQEALEKLREKQLEAEELEVKVRAQTAAWKDQIQHERQNVKAVFQKLKKNLKYEEVKEMQKLKNKEEVGLRNLADSEHVMIQQSQLVRNLISDVEHRLKESTMEMLQVTLGKKPQSETLTLKKPRTLPKEQRRMSSALDLTGIQRVYNGEECYLSGCPWNSCDAGKMGRRLQFLDNDDVEDYGVLGSLVITSQKYHWEANVSEKPAWILGLCDGKQHGYNMKFLFENNGNCQYVYWRYHPKYNYWIIGSLDLNHLPDCPPHCIGVFLDYNTDVVLFVNVRNQGILIHKFSSCSFTQKMFPYFNLGKCNESFSTTFVYCQTPSLGVIL
uniref:Tripartite motif-containing protein 5-like n=1 Tax=Moschus moschiferus TaxID=68415 RepID=A0A8C6D2U0_MOSMO